MNKLPKARTQNFVVQETANEVLIYDLATNKAFCLNETAAIVFNACDGKTPFAELSRKYDFTDELIFLTLDSLSKENLLVENFENPLDRMQRREVLKRIGLSSMVILPLISGIIAPNAAQAQSGIAPGSRTLYQTCTTSTECATTAPNCVNTPQGTRCCVNNGNSAQTPSTQFFGGSVCGGFSCANCQCAIDYCNANATPCCSGTFASANYNSTTVFCNC